MGKPNRIRQKQAGLPPAVAILVGMGDDENTQPHPVPYEGPDPFIGGSEAYTTPLKECFDVQTEIAERVGNKGLTSEAEFSMLMIAKVIEQGARLLSNMYTGDSTAREHYGLLSNLADRAGRQATHILATPAMTEGVLFANEEDFDDAMASLMVALVRLADARNVNLAELATRKSFLTL